MTTDTGSCYELGEEGPHNKRTKVSEQKFRAKCVESTQHVTEEIWRNLEV